MGHCQLPICFLISQSESSQGGRWSTLHFRINEWKDVIIYLPIWRTGHLQGLLGWTSFKSPGPPHPEQTHSDVHSNIQMKADSCRLHFELSPFLLLTQAETVHTTTLCINLWKEMSAYWETTIGFIMDLEWCNLSENVSSLWSQRKDPVCLDATTVWVHWAGLSGDK